MNFIMFGLLALTLVVTAASQTLFKHVLSSRGTVLSADKTFLGSFVDLVLVPSFLGALVLYGLAFVLWIYLLSRSQLSLIYPIGIALNVLLTLITAKYLLGESFTAMHAAGVVVILIGIAMVTR